MKKKYIAILLGITLGMTTLVGCSGTNTSESSTIQESQSVTGATENSDKRVSEAETADVYGEVTAISEDSITIKEIVECRGKIIFEMSRWIDYAATFRYNLYTNRKQAVDLTYNSWRCAK